MDFRIPRFLNCFSRPALKATISYYFWTMASIRQKKIETLLQKELGEYFRKESQKLSITNELVQTFIRPFFRLIKWY